MITALVITGTVAAVAALAALVALLQLAYVRQDVRTLLASQYAMRRELDAPRATAELERSLGMDLAGVPALAATVIRTVRAWRNG